MDLDRDIQEIQSTRQEVKKYFFLSLPGALWFIEKLAIEGYAEKIYHVAHRDIPTINLIPLVLPFALWLLPFEQAEKHMANLKQRIRDHMKRSGETISPIQYSPIEKLINIAMIPFFDKSALPPDH